MTKPTGRPKGHQALVTAEGTAADVALKYGVTRKQIYGYGLLRFVALQPEPKQLIVNMMRGAR